MLIQDEFWSLEESLAKIIDNVDSTCMLFCKVNMGNKIITQMLNPYNLIRWKQWLLKGSWRLYKPLVINKTRSDTCVWKTDTLWE